MGQASNSGGTVWGIYQNTTGHEQGVGCQTCSSIGMVEESDNKGGGGLGSFAPFRLVARCGAASGTSCNNEDLYCLMKWPGRKQFMQRSFALSVDIILLCGRDLNHVQTYSVCLSVLQRIQLVVGSAALAAKDATGLLDGGFFFV